MSEGRDAELERMRAYVETPEQRAMQEIVHARILDVSGPASVAITMLDDETDGISKQLGSGVLVEIGGRILVATCDHVRQGPVERMTIVLRDGPPNATPKIRRSGRRPLPADLAWFEIDAAALPSSNAVAVPLDRLRVAPFEPEFVFASGFPGKKLDADERKFMAGYFSFPTQALGGEPCRLRLL